MILESQFWPSLIALLAGGISGLGLLKSRGWVLALAFGLGIVQIIGWMILSMIFPGANDETWGTVLWANFLVALMVVVPYTTIDAIVGSAVIALARPVVRRRLANLKFPVSLIMS